MSSLLRDTTILLLVTVLIGLSIGFLTPVSLQATFQPEWHASFQVSFFLGAIFGAGIWTALFHSQDRVYIMDFACVVASMGWALVWACSSGQLGARLSTNLLFLIGRKITGFACAVLLCAVSVHLFEIAPDAWIGTFGCLPWLGFQGAIGVMQTLIPVLSWRTMALSAVILALLLRLLLCRLSESDKWLSRITSEQSEAQPLLESEQSPYSQLIQLISKMDSNNPASTIKLASRMPSGSVENGQSPRSKKQTGNSRYVALWLMLLQQLTGAQVLVYFSELLYQFAPDRWSLGYGWMIGFPQVLCGLLCAFSSNRVALVHLLRGSAVAMAMVHLMLGYLLMYPQMKPISTLLIVCIILGLSAHALGWGPIPLLVVNRLASTEQRGRAVGWAMIFSWVANLCMTMLFEPLLTLLGVSSYFWLVSAFCLLTACFVHCFLSDATGPDVNSTPVRLKVPKLPYLNGTLLLQLGKVIQVDTGSVFQLARRNLPCNSRPKGI